MASAATDEHRHAERQPLDQTAESVQVAEAGRLLNRAGREEQRALEDGVEDDVQERGHQGDDGQRRDARSRRRVPTRPPRAA